MYQAAANKLSDSGIKLCGRCLVEKGFSIHADRCIRAAVQLTTKHDFILVWAGTGLGLSATFQIMDFCIIDDRHMGKG